MNADVERTAIRKIYLRLLPLLFLSYFICSGKSISSRGSI